ncbi:unnamed protein product [Zymoseptoria tritici ST99CH_1A5]|uniref:Glycosyltransferase family 25 protein n=1 Tax=Zymoseptoria tritici ST99CH_1A5 TaxID=1276529 RepID=A0A1Y6LW30_ZYMTR|nr:unnamed protein product [Zymoseptoria tritici ST99CH_1A5]
MIVAANRRSWSTVGVLLLTTIWTYVWFTSWKVSTANLAWSRNIQTSKIAQAGPGASNDTLGFGAIYVLTENTTTWRVQGLIRAANLTGLSIQIPVQDHISDEAVLAHTGKEPTEGYGHARALLNHLSLLETFLASDHSTALIFEDDVDFSIHIRSQMSLISGAFYNHSAQNPESRHLDPYLHSTWDIFWPGHFGMQFADNVDIFHYKDSHALPWAHLTSEFNNYYTQMAETTPPEDQQLVFNVAPLATFAYAITRSHAVKLLSKLRSDRAEKFDNALHVECKGLWQRCVAPVPQVFHHHQVEGEKSLSSEEGRKEEVEGELGWYMRRHKWTYNVEWSARCNALETGTTPSAPEVFNVFQRLIRFSTTFLILTGLVSALSTGVLQFQEFHPTTTTLQRLAEGFFVSSTATAVIAAMLATMLLFRFEGYVQASRKDLCLAWRSVGYSGLVDFEFPGGIGDVVYG